VSKYQELQTQIANANKQRTKLAGDLSKGFNQKTVDDLAAVQANLKTLTTQANAAKLAEGGTNAGDSCTITLIRGGKDDTQLTVPIETTLQDALGKINWESQGMDFKRMIGPGVTEQIKDVSTATFGPGNHEIFVTPKVTGGKR
jgi:hypothetical protein